MATGIGRNIYEYLCSNPKCPRNGEVQTRNFSPEDWAAQAQGTGVGVLCLSCGWQVEFQPPA